MTELHRMTLTDCAGNPITPIGFGYATTNANFTQPDIGSNVAVTMTATQMFAANMAIFIATGGYYMVVSVDTLTQLTIQNTGAAVNASPASTISSGALVTTAGAVGATGPTGPTGAGVPAGGCTGQVLTKNSDSDYDDSWQPTQNYWQECCGTIFPACSVCGDSLCVFGSGQFGYDSSATGCSVFADSGGIVGASQDAHADSAGQISCSYSAEADSGGAVCDGYYAHADSSGYSSGSYSHSDSGGTVVGGSYSHANSCGRVTAAQAHASGCGEADACFAWAHGDGARATIYGQHACASGSLFNTGDAQGSSYFYRGQTSDETTFSLSSGASLQIPSYATFQFVVQVAANCVNAALGAGFLIKGAMRNYGGVSLIGSTTQESWIDSGLLGISADVTTDGTNLLVNVTGLSATPINWHAVILTSEVVGLSGCCC